MDAKDIDILSLIAEKRPREHENNPTPKKQKKTKQWRVAIIGSARGEDFKSLNSSTQEPRLLFDQMKTQALEAIQQHINVGEDLVLVSGGAAWADHVAVSLFLDDKCESLQLHIPACWDEGASTFEDNGLTNWRQNPGRLANTYHRAFSVHSGYRSLDEIHLAKEKGAIIEDHYRSFHARNTFVAKNADFLIAMTWGQGDTPISRGTLDTWKKARCPKIHLSLRRMVQKLGFGT